MEEDISHEVFSIFVLQFKEVYIAIRALTVARRSAVKARTVDRPTRSTRWL